MNENLVTNVEIYDADSYGRGVGKHEGKIVFVPFAAPGDVVDCIIISTEDNYDVATIHRLIKPSADRTEPPCPYFGFCPGCAYQHIAYGLELRLKGRRIVSCLVKLGGVDIACVPVAPSPRIYEYRTHVTLHLWYNGREARCGLIEPDLRKVIDIKSCLLLPKFAQNLQGRVKQICADLIGSYRGKFALRLPFIMDHLGERIMLAPGRAPMRKVRRMMRVMLETLQDEFPPIPKLERTFAGRSFSFNPLSFTQANEYQMSALYEKAKQLLAGQIKGKLLDLYSGVGVLGIVSAGEGGVTFVERSPTAVEDLKNNIRANGIEGIKIIEADVEDTLRGIVKSEEFAWVIMNPPRKGLPHQVPDILIKSGTKNLLYVSCNPATLGRDIARLSKGGFRVESVDGVDMFPRTPHVETVATLTRM